jgi:outer membrane lipoprotein-sorting protein
MRKALVFAIVCACALAAAGARAEDWPSLSKKLYDQCLGFNEAVKDLTLVMEMMNPSSDGAIVTESKLFQKRNKFRAEITIGGLEGEEAAMLADMKTIVIDDGTSVWIVNPVMGKSKMPPSEGSKYRGQWYCSEYIPAQAEIAGTETVGGRECWILAVKDEDADYSRIWIDAKSLALMKVESVSDEDETTTALFSDFRKIAGSHEFPHRTDIYAGNDLISTIVVKSVSVNTGLSDDLFDAEAAAGESAAGDIMKRIKDAIQEIDE